MELYTREKELLIMFGSERRLDTHKRLQNAIPYMTDSLYKVAAVALWNNISNEQYRLCIGAHEQNRLVFVIAGMWRECFKNL